MKSFVVDFHAHVLERGVFERSWMHNVASGFGAHGPAKPGSRQDQLHRALLDPDRHLEDMDRLGIDVSVLSQSTVVSGGQWADANTDLELNQRGERPHRRARPSASRPLRRQLLASTSRRRAVPHRVRALRRRTPPRRSQPACSRSGCLPRQSELLPALGARRGAAVDLLHPPRRCHRSVVPASTRFGTRSDSRSKKQR